MTTALPPSPRGAGIAPRSEPEQRSPVPSGCETPSLPAPEPPIGVTREKPRPVPVPAGRPATAIPYRTVACFPPTPALPGRSGGRLLIGWLFGWLVPLNKHGVFVLDGTPPRTRGYQRDGAGRQKGHRSVVPFFFSIFFFFSPSVFVTASSPKPGVMLP